MLNQCQIVSILTFVLIVSTIGLVISTVLQFMSMEKESDIQLEKDSSFLECCSKLSVDGLSLFDDLVDNIILEQVSHSSHYYTNVEPIFGLTRLPLFCQIIQVGINQKSVCLYFSSFPVKDECKKGCWLIGLFDISTSKILLGKEYLYQTLDTTLTCPNSNKNFFNLGNKTEEVQIKCIE